MATAPSSQVRQKYHQECEAAIRQQIDLELYASYVYLSKTYHFDPDDVALKNFAAYFLRQSCEERAHAETLLKLKYQRGGRTELCGIRRLDLGNLGSGLSAIECAFHLEQSINRSFQVLHRLATDKGDAQLCDFLESHFLQEQVRAIKELGDHVTTLRNLGAPDSSLAECLFDKFALGDSDKEN